MEPTPVRRPDALARFGWLMTRRPHDALWWLHRRYGEVVSVGWGPGRVVFGFGPRANRDILGAPAGSLRWRDAMAPLIPVDGETAIVVSDGEDHARRRRIVQPAFARRRIDAEIALMVAEIDDELAGWRPGRVVDAHAALRRVIRRIVIRMLFGDGLARRAGELGDLLEEPLAYVQRPPWMRVDRRWFGPYRRAMAARAAADAVVFEEIRVRRRRPGGPGDDVLGWLVAASDPGDGAGGVAAGLTDQEVRDQVVSLVAAGYDTTSAAAAWAVDHLVAHPGVARTLEEEVTDALGGAPPGPADLVGLPTLRGVVLETLRLRPPGIAAGRRVTGPIEVAGRTVPPGPMVMYSPWVTHRMPEVWPEPERFLPERWAVEPPPGSFVPFGGGARRCLGFGLATTELGVLVCRIAQTVRLERAGPPPRGAGLATHAPVGGVPVRVVARR